MKLSCIVILICALSIRVFGTTNDLPARVPYSSKGYCIFAYCISNETFFVLMFGTNRDKTFEEINDNATITTARFHLKAKGIEEGKRLLDLFDPSKTEHLPMIVGIRDTPTVRQSTIPESVTSASTKEINILKDLLAEKIKGKQ